MIFLLLELETKETVKLWLKTTSQLKTFCLVKTIRIKLHHHLAGSGSCQDEPITAM